MALLVLLKLSSSSSDVSESQSSQCSSFSTVSYKKNVLLHTDACVAYNNDNHGYFVVH